MKQFLKDYWGTIKYCMEFYPFPVPVIMLMPTAGLMLILGINDYLIGLSTFSIIVSCIASYVAVFLSITLLAAVK